MQTNKEAVCKISICDILDFFPADYIKIDIEGGEEEVLLGLLQSTHLPPTISLEVGHLSWSLTKLFNLLEFLGYDQFRWEPQTTNLTSGWRRTNWLPKTDKNFSETPPAKWCDLFCHRSEKSPHDPN